MNLLYNIGTRAYFAGIGLAARLGHRKARLMEAGRHDWAHHLEARIVALDQEDALAGRTPSATSRRFVWFHAASLGEFEQGRPLIEAIRARYPDRRILQTFFSPSGYEVRKGYKGADIVCYLPYDRPADCRRFLDLVRPELAVFVKYEFWGNMLEELQHRQIPAYLVSGIFRPRQVFFRPWGGLMRPVLRCFRHLFVQDEESRRLLASIGIDAAVTICGDTRFDRVIAIRDQAKTLPWAEVFTRGGELSAIDTTSGARPAARASTHGGLASDAASGMRSDSDAASGVRSDSGAASGVRSDSAAASGERSDSSASPDGRPAAAPASARRPFVLVAGSTWPDDEAILIPHFEAHPEMKLIIAPHEVHAERVQALLSRVQRPAVRYSDVRRRLDAADGDAQALGEVSAMLREADCLIIDAIGFLSGIYRYGDVAYIGGGFGAGIHNTLEAAVYGIPVIFGPRHQAFREAVGLIDAKGGFSIADAGGYEAVMRQMMGDEEALGEAGRRAGQYVKEGSGATNTIFRMLFG